MVEITMRTAAANDELTDTSLRKQVYDSLRAALMSGRFAPGQKLTFRFVAKALGVSLTPVREAVRRLVAEGAFEMQPNRSVRIPLMTKAKVLELRDIRVAVEGLAVGKAAEVATRAQIANLRRIAREIVVVRKRGDSVADREKISEFHFALYTISGQPTLLRVIEGLWLQTGPYMNLLFPDYIASAGGPARRLRIIQALQSRNAVAARREIENDVDGTLSYVAGLADEAGNIVPALPSAAGSRRSKGKASAALELRPKRLDLK